MNPIQIRAVKTFEQARDKIDENLLGIKNFLEAQGVGFRGKVVDNEGYPLPNIDHYRVAEERQHASRLLYDRRRFDFILEKLVETQYSSDNENQEQPLFLTLESLHPFAIVDEVMAKSPAENAKPFSLEPGDFILKIGNAETTAEVPFQISEGSPLNFKVYRVDQSGMNIIDITVTPAKWSGNGLIGAHILPIHE